MKTGRLLTVFGILAILITSCQSPENGMQGPASDQDVIDLSQWELTWADEFDYDNGQLDTNWISQNGPTEHPLVASSRWRENAVVKDGILELQVRKESRGGQDWTSGNVWTKRNFGYGYFEARYKYAAATATNNSFWLWPKHGTPEGAKACEVDINEGHFPNVINTNIHNWTDKETLPNGAKTHSDNQLHHTLHGDPVHTIQLNKAIKTTKIRLRTTNPTSMHLPEFRVYPASLQELPNALDTLSDNEMNLVAADDVKITSNGTYWALASEEAFAVDNNFDTRWVSRKQGEKWLQFEWQQSQEIGAIQFVNGWPQPNGAYRNLLTNYILEYFDGKQWITLEEYDSATIANYGEEFHTYGLQWDEDYFRFYLDGEMFLKLRNEVCFTETVILFSLAILKEDYAGPITDALDGTSMKVDYVRYYQPKN